MASVWAGLKRKEVVKVAVAYAEMAGLMTQIVDTESVPRKASVTPTSIPQYTNDWARSGHVD